MDRTKIAGIFLTASAMILALMVVVKIADVNPAQAGMNASGNNIELMTARGQPGGDVLFILDKENHILIVYTLELRGTRGRLTAVQSLNLRQAMGFEGGAAPAPSRPIPGGGGGLPR